MTEQSELVLEINKDLIEAIYVHKSAIPSKLSLEQLSALVLTATAPKMATQLKADEFSSNIETTYAQVKQSLKKYEPSNYIQIIESFEIQELYAGIITLRKHNIGLTEKAPSKVLKPKVDEKFSRVVGRPFNYNLEQDRLISFVHEGFEGSLDVQGAAGAGKTSIMYAIAKSLRERNPNATIVWITRSEALKYKVINEFGDSHIIPITAIELCEHFINPDERWGKRYKKVIDKETIMSQLGVVDQFDQRNELKVPAAITFRLVELTILKFCASFNWHIEQRHLPPRLQGQQAGIVLELAKRYWAMILDNTNNQIPVMPYHHVKYIHLNKGEARMKSLVDFLLVDETQDLSPSIMSIINYMIGKFSRYQRTATEGSVIIGDKFQALGSFNEWVTDEGGFNEDKNKSARDRKLLPQSERFGGEVSDMAKTVLSRGSYNSEEIKIIGSEQVESKITEFDWSNVDLDRVAKESPIVFLAQDLWAVLELAQRFVHAGIATFVPIETREAVKDLVTAALVFKATGKKLHEEFTAYSSWQGYMEVKNTELLSRVDHMFSRGYQKENLLSVLKKTSDYHQVAHTISLIEHMKGVESHRVALLPSSENVQLSNLSDSIRNRKVNKLYTGLTRAKTELLLPKGFDKNEL